MLPTDLSLLPPHASSARVGRLSQIRQLGHSFAMCLFLNSLTSVVTKPGGCKAW